MTRLYAYIRRYWHRYIFGILCTIATAVLLTIIPRLSGEAINAINRGDYPHLVYLTKLMIVVAFAVGTTRWFSRFVIFNCGRDVEYDLRNDLFTHLSGLDQVFYQRLKTGDLMSRMINDLGSVRMMIGMGVLSFTSTPVTFVFALAFMFSLSVRLTLATITPYIVLFVAIRFLTRSLMERSLKVQQALGLLGSKIQESLSGIHVVKAYGLEERERERFRSLNNNYNEQGLALARVRGAMMPLIRATIATSMMILLTYGGVLIQAGKISIGDLTAFILYLQQLGWPTVSIGWMISIYQRARASIKRLEDIFQAIPPGSVAGSEARLEINGAIEWEQVSFSYLADELAVDGAQRPLALRDINVKVPAGGKLAIVGRTGSGKSTMVKLLVRLIEPTRGRVLVDGRDVHELPLGALRKTVGLVPQDAILFSDTIAHNIAF